MTNKEPDVRFYETHPDNKSGVGYHTYVWCNLPPHQAKVCKLKVIGKCTHSNAPQLSEIMMDSQKSGYDHMRKCGM